GPGSNSQWGKISWIKPEGKISVFMQRIAFDKDYYYTIDSEPDTDYYAEFNCGVESLIYLNNIDLFSALVYTIDFNHNYINAESVSNFHFELGLKYHL
ncbi:MAG: hypothetical protein KAR21_18570, partial [Spirochaetales bacterium]|nr:hypothetical protein [Spirochaetales bacterium]